MTNGGILKKTIGITAVSHERFHFGAQRVVLAARLANKSASLSRTLFQREGENLFYLFPSFRHFNSHVTWRVRVPTRLLPLTNFAWQWLERFPERRRFLRHSTPRRSEVRRGELAVNRSQPTA